MPDTGYPHGEPRRPGDPGPGVRLLRQQARRDAPGGDGRGRGQDHGSWPKIPDIARAYLFLASPETHLVTGAAIPV